MIITSKDPQHLNLGRDIERVTLRMAHYKAIASHTLQAFRSALAILESFNETGPDGQLREPPEENTGHISSIKMILSDLQECMDTTAGEVNDYVGEFMQLDAALTKLGARKRRSRPKVVPQAVPVVTGPEAPQA